MIGRYKINPKRKILLSGLRKYIQLIQKPLSDKTVECMAESYPNFQYYMVDIISLAAFLTDEYKTVKKCSQTKQQLFFK